MELFIALFVEPNFESLVLKRLKSELGIIVRPSKCKEVFWLIESLSLTLDPIKIDCPLAKEPINIKNNNHMFE
jgi:hypothetical protein